MNLERRVCARHPPVRRILRRTPYELHVFYTCDSGQLGFSIHVHDFISQSKEPDRRQGLSEEISKVVGRGHKWNHNLTIFD